MVFEAFLSLPQRRVGRPRTLESEWVSYTTRGWCSSLPWWEEIVSDLQRNDFWWISQGWDCGEIDSGRQILDRIWSKRQEGWLHQMGTCTACQNMWVQWSFCQGKLPHQISVSSSLELLRSQVVSQKSIPRSRIHRTSRKFLAANHELTSVYWNVRTLRNFIARKRCFVTVFPKFLEVWVPVPGNTIFSTFQHPKYVKFSDPPIGGSIKYAQFLIFDFAGRQSVRIRNYGSGMSAP